MRREVRGKTVKLPRIHRVTAKGKVRAGLGNLDKGVEGIIRATSA